ncbi:MAG: (Fe-S)-binding protein [Proteobacteria bacterium]|nr:(Fe-S)-binding protein [Pseudomonadota bacterium]MBU1612348.1 (Fe-S)-binding protein [Pseudomonadota bacterium]
MTEGCVLCGKCLEVCPLLAATGREELSPRAKANLVQLLGRDPNALSEQDAATLAGFCLGCGRCKDACSQGVDVPGAVSRLRNAHPGWKAWVWKQWMERSKALWPKAGKAARVIPEGLAPGRLSGLLKLARGLGREPIAPCVRVESFPDSLRGTEALLFSGCTASGAAPHWTTAGEAICDGLGLVRINAAFSCCGSGLATAGLLDERLEAARRNVEIWRSAGRPLLVAFCASCTLGLAGYAETPALAGELFQDQAEAGQWAGSLTPLSSLLNSARFVVSQGAPQGTGYHRPCHLQGPDPDETLVRGMLGDRELAISKDCCGFGGILQLGAPTLSAQVASRCWKKLAPAPGTLVLTGCSACVLQLSATAPEGIQTAHWLEAIATNDRR